MADDIFLKLDGVKGESKDKDHKGEIDIDSFSWGASQTESGHAGGAGVCKATFHDISVTKGYDSASAKLMQFVANGKPIKDGQITFRKAGEKPLEYLKIKLEDIRISSCNYSGHAGGDGLQENVSLHFAKFKKEYQEQQSDGSGKPAGEVAWNIKANATA